MKVGGRQGKRFLDKVWTVALPLRDVVEAVFKENVDLKTQLGEAREEGILVNKENIDLKAQLVAVREEGILVNKENIDLKAQLVAVREEGIALRKSNHSLKSQVTFLSERNLEEVSSIERRRTNCEVDCSDRHLRRIKKRRTTNCVASLAWLEQVTLQAIYKLIQNKCTGEIETLKSLNEYVLNINDTKVLSFVTMIIHGYNCFIILNVKE